jgi:hypothetical protein
MKLFPTAVVKTRHTKLWSQLIQKDLLGGDTRSRFFFAD